TAARAAFAKPIRFDVPDGLSHPLRSVRLARAKEDLRRGLREHRLGIATVTSLELASTLETQHDWVVRFAVLCQCRVQLWQALETRKLVEDEPSRGCARAAGRHQA